MKESKLYKINSITYKEGVVNPSFKEVFEMIENVDIDYLCDIPIDCKDNNDFYKEIISETDKEKYLIVDFVDGKYHELYKIIRRNNQDSSMWIKGQRNDNNDFIIMYDFDYKQICDFYFKNKGDRK